MKQSIPALFLVAMVVAMPANAAIDDDEIEEVVVTAPHESPILIIDPISGLSNTELEAISEVNRQTVEALKRACEKAKQDAAAAGAMGGIFAGAVKACGHIKHSPTNTACTMAVGAAIAACSFTSPGGPPSDN